MAPLEGARDFLDRLRSRYQVIILSDTFYEFAAPLMSQLGHPTLFCHRLLVDTAGNVTDYQPVREAIVSACATMRAKSAPVSPVAAGRFARQMDGSSCARISAKSNFVFTLSGANSAMSTSPAQSSRCLMSRLMRGSIQCSLRTSR